ncbi:MAG: hypothetical protein KAT16_05940 [Candidatus Heimdallarchaeota archaeon]|nr:hypothetical protein [Candidatus Heimdallarchaeota archaeon]
MEELIEKLKERRKGIVYMLKMIPLEIWDWSPSPSSKTTAALANHLASSPLMMYKLFKGNLKTPDEFEELEKQNLPLNAQGLVKLYDNGLEKLINYLEENLDEAREKNLQFFYQEEKSSLYKEIFDEIGHEWFHTGMLFTYLRTNEISVDMGTYYGYKDPDPSIPPN